MMMGNEELIGYALAIGIGATAIMDLWAALQSRLFGVRPMNYAFVGRWLGHLWRGQMRHDAIANAPAVRGELFTGWAAHYAVGVAFAALLLGIRSIEWVRNPTLAPALLVGIGTVIFPFFILQPAFGAGFAASRMPRANVARTRSLLNHAVFGLGLYLAAWLLRLGNQE